MMAVWRQSQASSPGAPVVVVTGLALMGADVKRKPRKNPGETAAGTREPASPENRGRSGEGGGLSPRSWDGAEGGDQGCVACQDLAAAVAGGVDQDVLGFVVGGDNQL